MKKLFAALLSGMLLSSVLAVGVSAQQTNVDVDVLKFTKQPTFDGTVSKEEWGKPTLTVAAKNAANKDDNKEVSPENTYAEFEFESFFNKMYFDMWLRWDSEYFYLAVRVNDPDGHSLSNYADNMWNGDSLQFRIDPAGPSSGMYSKFPDFDYKNDPFEYKKFDLAGKRHSLWKNGNNLALVFAGLVDGVNAQAYEAMMQKPMTDAVVSINTVPNDPTQSGDDFGCVTTYEMAFTWASFFERFYSKNEPSEDVENFVPKDGALLGMTLVVDNGSGAGRDSLLTWGSGIHPEQGKNARKTIGGSNAIHLSDTSVTPEDSYAKTSPTVDNTEDTFAPPQTQSVTESEKVTGTGGDETQKDSTKTDMSGIGGGLKTWIIAAVAVCVLCAGTIITVVLKKKSGKKE